MIRHIVMWRVAGDTPEARLAASREVKVSFEGLRGRIPGMTHLEVGIDSSGVDYACDAVLVTDFESRIYRKDGSIIWIAENCRAVRDALGKLLYYEGTVEDITERKRAELEQQVTTKIIHSKMGMRID